MALPRNEAQGEAMKPERWHEIVRLYYAALERKPEERAAFVREEGRGDESLRKEIESLVACRPQAEKFMESPVLEAGEGTLAENRQVESVASGAQRIQVVRGEAGPRTGRQRMLPPWWILILSVPFAALAGFLYFWLFFGPEPVGWMVQVDGRAGSEGWNRIATVLPDSPAAKAGFESGDLISSKDLDQFRTYRHG